MKLNLPREFFPSAREGNLKISSTTKPNPLRANVVPISMCSDPKLDEHSIVESIINNDEETMQVVILGKDLKFSSMAGNTKSKYNLIAQEHPMIYGKISDDLKEFRVGMLGPTTLTASCVTLSVESHSTVLSSVRSTQIVQDIILASNEDPDKFLADHLDINPNFESVKLALLNVCIAWPKGYPTPDGLSATNLSDIQDFAKEHKLPDHLRVWMELCCRHLALTQTTDATTMSLHCEHCSIGNVAFGKKVDISMLEEAAQRKLNLRESLTVDPEEIDLKTVQENSSRGFAITCVKDKVVATWAAAVQEGEDMEVDPTPHPSASTPSPRGTKRTPSSPYQSPSSPPPTVEQDEYHKARVLSNCESAIMAVEDWHRRCQEDEAMKISLVNPSGYDGVYKALEETKGRLALVSRKVSTCDQQVETKTKIFKTEEARLEELLANLRNKFQAEVETKKSERELLVEESANLSSKSAALESKLEDELKQWGEQQQQADLATEKTRMAGERVEQVKDETKQVQLIVRSGEVGFQTKKKVWVLVKYSLPWDVTGPDLLKESQVVGDGTEFNRNSMDNAQKLLKAVKVKSKSGEGLSHKNLKPERQKRFASSIGLMNGK